MERRSMSDLIRQLEPLLRKFEGDNALEIAHVEEKEGCKAGDNYMSIVMQTTVKGSRGNGTNYSESFMIKYLPLHREITAIYGTRDLFRNEIHVYDRVLPALGDFGPVCVHADEDKIVMQDLRASGYKVRERRDLLDLDHSVAAVQTLARLHASSLALKLRDPSGFSRLVEPLKEVVFPRQAEHLTLGASIVGSVTNAIKHLEWIRPRSEELEAGIRFLKSHEDRVYSTLQDLVDPGRGEWDVITHGDCWKNNVMFKYDENGKVRDVRLLDFQMLRHVSPAIDFHYFIYSSLKSSVIEENYEDLVEAYHSKFADTLNEKPGISEDSKRRFTLGWFRNELKKCSNYGIFTGCWLAPGIIAEEDEMLDLDNLNMEVIEEMEKKEVKIKPELADRLKSIVLDYVRRYT